MVHKRELDQKRNHESCVSDIRISDPATYGPATLLFIRAEIMWQPYSELQTRSRPRRTREVPNAVFRIDWQRNSSPTVCTPKGFLYTHPCGLET